MCMACDLVRWCQALHHRNYAHHLSTIEGGMVCTDDENLYEAVRMLRSHGMVRELSTEGRKLDYVEEFPDLNPDFIFAFPAYNVRSTAINAVMGRSQLRRLDDNNQRRTVHPAPANARSRE